MRRLLSLLLVGVVVTACGHSSAPRAGPSGPGHFSRGVGPACCATTSGAQVSGALVGIGGPSGAAVQHWSGTVHVRGRVSATISTDDRGHFSVRLPAGRYTLSATSPSYDGGRGVCRAPHAVVLRAHRTSHVQVICQLR